MKKFGAMAILALSAGCGGISEQDLRGLEGRIDAKISKTASDLDRRITSMDAKYATMLQMEQRVQNGVEKIDANAKLLESANDRMIVILSAQKNALKEQLVSVEQQLEALQKK